MLHFDNAASAYNSSYNDVHAKFNGKSSWVTPEMSLSDYIHHYAPKSDNNNPVRYTEFMANKLNQALGENVITKDSSLGDIKEALIDAGLDADHVITQSHLAMENPRILKDLNIIPGKSTVDKQPTPPVRKSTVVEKKQEPAKVAPRTPVTYNPNPTFTASPYPQPPASDNPKPASKPNTPTKATAVQEKSTSVAPSPIPGVSMSTISDVTSAIANSKIGEIINSASTQGIGAAASQLWAGITSPNEGLQQSTKPLPEKEINVNPGKTTKIKVGEAAKEKPVAYIPLGSKVENYKGDADRYLEPFKVNGESAKFGVRSRSETRDVQTKGVVFTTYKPWTYASSPEYTKGNDSFNYYLLVNDATGDLKVTTNPKQDPNSLLNNPTIKGNPKMLTTGSYGRVVKELNMNGLYNDGIKSKTLGYVSHDGKKASIPVFGIGNGSDLGGYVGGKLLLAHPDGSNPTIIYGSAEIVIDQFNKYKKDNNLKNVLVVDADGKSYAQSYQTKSNKIPGSVLTSNQWDNANTASAGSGNILYLK